jgi:hypothetical protein
MLPLLASYFQADQIAGKWCTVLLLKKQTKWYIADNEN